MQFSSLTHSSASSVQPEVHSRKFGDPCHVKTMKFYLFSNLNFLYLFSSLRVIVVCVLGHSVMSNFIIP